MPANESDGRGKFEAKSSNQKQKPCSLCLWEVYPQRIVPQECYAALKLGHGSASLSVMFAGHVRLMGKVLYADACEAHCNHVVENWGHLPLLQHIPSTWQLLEKRVVVL